jgi:hypothetical protein
MGRPKNDPMGETRAGRILVSFTHMNLSLIQLTSPVYLHEINFGTVAAVRYTFREIVTGR